jgi:hypothetical protein
VGVGLDHVDDDVKIEGDFHLTSLHDEHGDQGTFWGKRAGVSPALNKTARYAVGYDAKRRRLPAKPAQPEASTATARRLIAS